MKCDACRLQHLWYDDHTSPCTFTVCTLCSLSIPHHDLVRMHVTRRFSHVTRHTSHITRHTSHVTRHTSHVTRQTSHVTRHTSHVTRHTSHVTRHTSHVTFNERLICFPSFEKRVRKCYSFCLSQCRIR